jgi:hypothetical protein
MSVQVYTNLDALPERVTAFAAAAARGDFFRSLEWLRTVLKTAAPAGDEARLYVAEHGDRPVAALIAGERREAGRLKTHMLLGAGQGMYSATYGPLLDPGEGAAGLREITAALARASPPYDVLRFGGIDQGAPDCAALPAAFRASAMIVQCFANYQHWSEDVRGLTFAQYLAGRPAHVRAFARRGCPGLPDVAGSRFELVSDEAALGVPLIDYALVDLRSATPPEAYPDCIAETARVAARLGVLRLGLLYIGDRPAGAQIWIVAGGRATQWRHRHAEGYAGLPIRTALTMAMLRRLFESDCLARIEFSRDGADAAEDWAGRCDQRSGMIVANPRTAKGLLAAVRHIGGHWAMTAARRLGLSANGGGLG